MDKDGYEAINNVVGGLKGDVIVSPWPLNMGPLEEDSSDFDPDFHIAENADVRFIDISFNRANRAAHVLIALDEAGFIEERGSESTVKKPCLRLLGVIFDAQEGVTELTLEDVSARRKS